MTDRASVWQLGSGLAMDLDRPRLMGILNATPDSFSDGGTDGTVEAAITRTCAMVADGAAMIDVGGESTRPGARRVDADEQIARVVPVVRGVRERLGDGVPISVDTTLAKVAEAAIRAGANAINDVSAGAEDSSMLALAAELGVGLVLMHRLRPPDADVFSHQHASAPAYPGGVVEEVRGFLARRAEEAMRAGVPRAAIVLDPGLGFGKSVAQNLELIARTGELVQLGFPVLSALSRKSFAAVYGGIPTDLPPRERVRPTLELSALHQRAGASIFRVHDVPEHVRLFRG